MSEQLSNSQKRAAVKNTDKKLFAGKPGPGRTKGIPNKTTALLKDAILQAAEKAGGAEGLVGYLTIQATDNPQSFLPLLGKVLPMQVTGAGEDGEHVMRIELVGIAPK